MAGTGSESTTLIVLRGNSASGKSTVASAVRDSCGPGIAIVGQDNLRRTVLRERDVPGGAYIGLVDSVARYALDHGYHTIVEGILAADRCAGMLTALRADHRGGSHYYYFDVPLEETFRRHATKPQASDYGRAEMSRWYRDHDLLPGGIEQIIPVTSTLDATIGRILRDTGLPMLNPPVLSVNSLPRQSGAGLKGRPADSPASPFTSLTAPDAISKIADR